MLGRRRRRWNAMVARSRPFGNGIIPVGRIFRGPLLIVVVIVEVNGQTDAETAEGEQAPEDDPTQQDRSTAGANGGRHRTCRPGAKRRAAMRTAELPLFGDSMRGTEMMATVRAIEM